MSHEIIEITGGSTSKVKRKESLEDKRQWEYGIIGTAHQSSTDLTNNPPKSVNDKLGELEAKFKSHPQRHYPQWPEATLRTITPSRDSLPKVTQSYGATERIIANGRSILDKLGEPDHHVASHLNQEERQNIAFLVILANDQYGKGYRGKAKKANDGSRLGKEPMKESNDKPDERSKEKIKRKLAIYIDIGNTLDQWKKFMNGEGEQPSLAKTLTLGLEQANMRVETIDDRFKQRSNSLTFYEIPKLQQSSEENSITRCSRQFVTSVENIP